MRHVDSAVRLAITLSIAAVAGHALAAEVPADADNTYTLGEVRVLGDRVSDATSDDRASAAEVWQFNANTLTDAVKLVPGVTSSFNSNGRRNEGDISVRGFDRWRVPLAIDGIRVYLPADNRIDFNRFLTPDLAEVQVRKGRVSVLDGPGAMGGLVNLVTRKPVKPFEAEVQGGASFDRGANRDGWSGTAIVGTKQDLWYAQGSGTEVRRDSWTLSKDFDPVEFLPTARPHVGAEDGGERNGSATKDWRVNFKAGFTPNATDEYSLNYTKQNGEKGAPLGVDFFLPNGCINSSPPQSGCTQAGPYQGNNFWTWPRWDVESASWASQTQLGSSGYVKTRASLGNFDNELFAWDDGNYNSQSANGRFRSYYSDDSLGGSVEAGASFADRSMTRAALFFRRDRHTEYNDNRPTNPNTALHTIEPKQHNEEQTWSLAVENTWYVSAQTDLIGGVSYDRNELKRAEEYGNPDENRGVSCAGGAPNDTCLYDYPLGNSNSFNFQFALVRHYSDSAQVSFSLSSRSRFPNNFERFSTRFGTNLPNPDLDPERANHLELGWQKETTDGGHVSAAVFYTDVQELIQTVVVTPGSTTASTLTQARNVGDGSNYGVELAGDLRIATQLRIGANYSYLHRRISDPSQPGLRATGAPDHLGFAYIAWEPLPMLTVQPSVELAGNRWSDVNGSSSFSSVRTGRYALVNLQLSWRPIANVEAVLGARNLLDSNFELAPGFPEPGVSMFTKVRVKF
jgi:iron complex outermembrane receptor protein